MKKLDRNDVCWCGSGKKYKVCHSNFDDKLMALKRQGHIVPSRSMIKTPEQINGIREAGKINIAILDYVAENIKAGMSTEDINTLVHDKTIELKGIPAPLGFEGFPKSVCTSVNDEVCHGIPTSDMILKDGDIINVDVSTIYNGYYADSSRMFCIGQVSDYARKLVEVTKEAMDLSLAEVKPWNFLGDVSEVMNNHAKKHGFSIVEVIGGHGVGLEFHEEPFVSHVAPKGTEMVMVPGMCFTIEPMINGGGPDVYCDDDNGWTIYTEDGSLSAQWEYQIVITEDGYEIVSY